VVAGKTGSLIATSARYGAIFGGATTEVQLALTKYGEIVGAAFQLSDDILDVVSESGVSGKTPGTDLREGRTDPAGAHRPRDRAARGRPADRAARRTAHRRRPSTPRPSPCCAATLPSTRPGPYVIARAAEAKAQLVAVPEGPVRTALEEFADIVATRAS
jgi:heptaprenyl diphosphate synthase